MVVSRGSVGAVVSKIREKLFPVLKNSLVVCTKIDFAPSGAVRIILPVKRSVSDHVRGLVVKSPVIAYVVGVVVVIST